MNRIRDAAYTAACAPQQFTEKAAKIIAGHSFGGKSDAYVVRDTETIRPVCEHIEQTFFPPKRKKAKPKKPAKRKKGQGK